MTYLNDQFVAAARREPQTVTIDDRELTVRHSSFRFRFHIAELEVLEGDSIVGYITPYGTDERGAVAAGVFGWIAPKLFRELEPALREILNSQPSH